MLFFFTGLVFGGVMGYSACAIFFCSNHVIGNRRRVNDRRRWSPSRFVEMYDHAGNWITYDRRVQADRRHHSIYERKVHTQSE